MNTQAKSQILEGQSNMFFQSFRGIRFCVHLLSKPNTCDDHEKFIPYPDFAYGKFLVSLRAGNARYSRYT